MVHFIWHVMTERLFSLPLTKVVIHFGHVRMCATPCPISLIIFILDLGPSYAPVICIPGSPGAGDSGDIAGLKCLALTSGVSRQCLGFAGVMISRQYTVTLIQIRF